MSAVEDLQRGDRIEGPDDTLWHVVEPVDRPDASSEAFVWLEALDGGDLWIEHDECERQLTTGTFEHVTQPEADQ